MKKQIKTKQILEEVYRLLEYELPFDGTLDTGRSSFDSKRLKYNGTEDNWYAFEKIVEEGQYPTHPLTRHFTGEGYSADDINFVLFVTSYFNLGDTISNFLRVILQTRDLLEKAGSIKLQGNFRSNGENYQVVENLNGVKFDLFFKALTHWMYLEADSHFIDLFGSGQNSEAVNRLYSIL